MSTPDETTGKARAPAGYVMRRKQLLWFVGLWLAGFATVAGGAYLLRGLIGL